MFVRDLELSVSQLHFIVFKAEKGSESTYWTPLQYACAIEDEELVRDILSYSPRLANAVGHAVFNIPPLQIAARYGTVAILKLLLQYQASPDSTDPENGIAAIHIAAAHGHTEAVRVLQNAYPQNISTNNGSTPMDLANHMQETGIVDVLINSRQKLKGTNDVRSWLASIGMLEYAQSFEKEGYDDAEFLLQNGVSEVEIDKMEITKFGHRQKIFALYKLKEYITDKLESKEEYSAASEESVSESEDEE